MRAWYSRSILPARMRQSRGQIALVRQEQQAGSVAVQPPDVA